MIILMVFVCGLHGHGEQTCRKLPDENYPTIAACEVQARRLRSWDTVDNQWVTALCARPPS